MYGGGFVPSYWFVLGKSTRSPSAQARSCQRSDSDLQHSQQVFLLEAVPHLSRLFDFFLLLLLLSSCFLSSLLGQRSLWLVHYLHPSLPSTAFLAWHGMSCLVLSSKSGLQAPSGVQDLN